MQSVRHWVLHWVLACLVFGLVATVAPAPVQAQTKLEAHYVALLAGIPIGRGAWDVQIGPNQFTAAASGAASGILRLFAAGEGSTVVRGVIAGGQFVPQAYASGIKTDRKLDQVRMVMAGGQIKDVSVVPPLLPDPDRIPVTDAHRHGVLDPMTASLTHVGGSGELLSPATCDRSIPVFDGRVRYDLKTTYKRMDKVKAEKGYQGPAVVCAVHFIPIAGYIPDRPIVKYLTEQKDMEVWLSPISGTRVVVPFRIEVPTPIGQGTLIARDFVTAPLQTAASAKTQ